jgi:DNA polymerase IV
VVVAWKDTRSVVCAASNEARVFGVRSAIPAVRAERLCPDAIFVAPDFTRYRAVSKSVREIFQRHTDPIEPLSLDEAYLDVTENKAGLPTAPLVARTIREQIRQKLSLSASGRSSTQQVPGQARLGLAQTGWALCHPARGNRWISGAIAR